MTVRLDARGRLVIGNLTERGELVIGNLTASGQVVFPALAPPTPPPPPAPVTHHGGGVGAFWQPPPPPPPPLRELVRRHRVAGIRQLLSDRDLLDLIVLDVITIDDLLLIDDLPEWVIEEAWVLAPHRWRAPR